LAWVLAGEVAALEEELRPKTLEMIYEPVTARELAAHLRTISQDFPAIYSVFQEPETLTDAEAESEKQSHRQIGMQQLSRVKPIFDSWMGQRARKPLCHNSRSGGRAEV
jgi:hypothetical protein